MGYVALSADDSGRHVWNVIRRAHTVRLAGSLKPGRKERCVDENLWGSHLHLQNAKGIVTDDGSGMLRNPNARPC